MATPPMLRPREGSPVAPRTTADPVASIATLLLGIVLLGLVVTGILAVADWRTPGVVVPLAIAVAAIFGVTIVMLVTVAAARYAWRARR